MAVLLEKTEQKLNTDLEQEKQRLYGYWKNSRMISNDSVLDAFLEVPRELFVERSFRDESYADHPLPIFCGQTISQPTTVILMLQLLDVLPGVFSKLVREADTTLRCWLSWQERS